MLQRNVFENSSCANASDPLRGCSDLLARKNLSSIAWSFWTYYTLSDEILL